MISLARTALIVGVFLAVVACDEKATQPQNPAAVTVPGAPYGANPAAAGTFEHDGVSLCYETYGDGPPLLIVHGNGASIGSMAAQIEFFKRSYTVIAMDSRDHGRSADSRTALTYEAMTDDLAGMMSKEPNIDFELIEQIKAPTLILAGDHDMVRIEHVVEIFNRLQNGQLGILPNSTHMAPYDNPELFNGTIERFLATPFSSRDRIADFLTSYERLLANLPR